MITEKMLFHALEVALGAAGEDVAPMSNLIGQPARVFMFQNRVTTYSFFAVDAIFREDGAVVLQESNGSNGASTGMLPDGQARRARHMVETWLARGIQKPCVALLAHADKTGLKAEFHTRQTLFAKELRIAGAGSVEERIAGESLGVEDISVIIGPISALLRHLAVSDGALHYMGRKVGFASNSNVIPALQRRGEIQRTANGFSVDTSIFHESARGVEIALDKAEQQRVAVGTGLTPLRHVDCPTWDCVAEEIRTWHKQGLTPVAKVNNGSQGVGIGFFPPQHAGWVNQELRRMRKHSLIAYGPEADKTALPVRLFEFAASTRYRLPDGQHLWDVRIECHISPGTTVLIPDSMRICPSPFRKQEFSRDSVLSNLSGRASGLDFVRTPFAHHDPDRTELKWAGITEDNLASAMSALANWCESAIQPRI